MNGFSAELAFKIAMGSGLLNTLCTSIAKAGGASDSTAPTAARLIESAAVLYFLHAVGKENSAYGITLVEGVHAPLADLLDHVEQHVSRELTEGALPSGMTQTLNVGIQKCRMALENEDYDALLQSTAEVEKELETASEAQKPDKAWQRQQNAIKELVTIIRGFRVLMRAQAGSSIHSVHV